MLNAQQPQSLSKPNWKALVREPSWPATVADLAE
jgi:hypothetical protein